MVANFQVRDLTVSFLGPAQPSELEGAVKNLTALNPQMSVLAPEPLRNVGCASPWLVLAEGLVLPCSWPEAGWS